MGLLFGPTFGSTTCAVEAATRWRSWPGQPRTSLQGGHLLCEWGTPPGQPDVRLYQHGSRYRLWIDGGGSYEVDPEGGRIVVPEDEDGRRREQLLWSLPSAVYLLHRGDLPIHSAAVEIDGIGVLLGAPGGHGKTTLAAACYQAGHRVLSEDLTCVRLSPDPVIIPGPAMLRLRRDVLESLGLSDSSSVFWHGNRVSLALDRQRGDCRPVPLGAMVLLRRDAHAVRSERVCAVDAVRDLWELSFYLPSDDGMARCFAQVVDLARIVPVWNLYRPMRVDILPSVVALIEVLAAGHGR